MNRPRAYTIAAVLLIGYSLVGLLFEVPNLARGDVQSDDAPPFFLTLINASLILLGLFAAFGVWRVQKWGVILAIIVSGLAILTSLPAILFAPPLVFRIIAGIGIIWLAAIIVLLLRPLGGRRAASDRHPSITATTD